MPTEEKFRQSTASPEDAAAARLIIAHSRQEDYDGHTEFARMSPAERLAWLDAAVMLVESRRNPNSRQQGC